MEKAFRNNLSKYQKVITLLLLASLLAVFGPTIVKAEQSDSTNFVETEEIISPNIIRHEGIRRENVAENVAKTHFSKSNKVIIVNRTKFPDAISATSVSQGRYPVLYTHTGSVSKSTIDLLKTMPLDEIYILGGTHSVNEGVISQLKEEIGVKITRLAGRNRYDANVNAVKANFTQKKHVIVASGEVYPDALYGVSYANTIDAPVILTNTNKLEASTVQLLKDLGVNEATIIGGEATVTPQVAAQLDTLNIKHNRIAGKDRYAGSAEVAVASYENPTQAVIASGDVFSDALVSAPLAQKLNAPILLVRADSIEKPVSQYLIDSRLDLENIYLHGGALTITEDNKDRINNLTTFVVVNRVLPIETKTQEDETLLAGETELVQEGEEGYEEIFYDVTFKNGVETSRTEFNRITKEAVPKIVKVGTRVDVESIQLSETDLVLTEEESKNLTATVLPENATNKKVNWSSSDEAVVTVDEQGVVQAHKAGEATLTVSDSTGKISNKVIVTVSEPTIVSIDKLAAEVTQFDDYTLPNKVLAEMSNGLTREYEVKWSAAGPIDTSALGTQNFSGTVEDYDQPISFTLEVIKYNPELVTNAYSSITVNGLSQRININLTNYGTKSVNIDKIEIYESGKLYLTYTPEDLEASDISTTVEPNQNWGISVSSKLGIWVDGSYVKYYVSANDTNYEYEVSLER